MANVLTVPNSGIISFDSLPYSNLEVQPLSSSSRISYNGLGGITISSKSLSEDRFAVEGISGVLFTIKDTLTGYTSEVTGDLNVTNEILSAGVELHDILSQRLDYDSSNYELELTKGNVVNLSSLSYFNVTPSNVVKTIQEFAATAPTNLFPGYTITLYNGRVYTYAGTDPSNPAHYLEVNTNPYTPIYREIPMDSNSAIIDTFQIDNYKSAKYMFQVETNFNNEIYYSEINVICSIDSNLGVACEYGQLYTQQLIVKYDVELNVNQLRLKAFFSNEEDINKKLIFRGHRTNFYRI